MNHEQVADRVIKYVGKDNLIAAAHCATRLRLVIKDTSKIDQTGLDNDDDIKGTFSIDGQYQIIIGPGDVDKVYNFLIKKTGLKGVTPDDLKNIASSGKKTNPVLAVVKLLSDIFVPLIPALVAGGLLMAINNLLTSPDLFGPLSVVQMYPGVKGLSELINLLASAPFTFMPVLIGYSATKRFGGNPYLGAAIGMAMVMPSLVSGYDVANFTAAGKMTYWNIFGLKVAQAGYQGQVLPVLAVSWILATIEKWLHDHMPATLDFIFTPLIAVIITGLLTFIGVGPVMRIVSDGVTNGIVWLYNTAGFIGTGIFGTFYSAIVVTGLHQSFPVVETQLLTNISKTGGDFIFPIASMANVAQGAACLAVLFITNNKKQKGLASSAGISALLGITEPAIFGVNLKLRYPFYCAMIASGIASVFVGIFHVLSSALGAAGVIGFISLPPKNYLPFFISIIISMGVSFSLTYVYGKKFAKAADTDDSEDAKGNANLIAVADEVISAPVTGELKSLSTVNDQVFSAEIMGKGAAIIPSDNNIYAPATGVVTVAYETKHAYGIKTSDGAEVLIHLGIDTVNLKGKFFTSNVKQGDTIKKGDLLGTFDIEKLKDAGFDTTVMVVITNTMSYGAVEEIKVSDIEHGDDIIALTQLTANYSSAAVNI
ncbi:sucrose-specific PTS transporter subunit IIBC [Companilactobacillus allii]|uniref:protein-N(pi)-phosphohistidine--sucrose phosphotransferase n=1 Tax=Companilactobacillus allii TaxID=1847728 RepID=A0A1P8Q5W2_9LACO|nr:sucrose-specific PTS transporter subunit IIBC [Companilactobacillus allii]APX73230.1 PTS beta-glucoside transporter subunit EIIBCA [Companilactobacillus allii]USQ68042.1 sucrose-specific PTS transporter subunit IIBC [Companilactobacillus allii]